jgi:quinol monooxygenase YgiN
MGPPLTALTPDLQLNMVTIRFVVVEKWASMALLGAHAASPHMKAYGASTKEMLADRVIHVMSDA